MRVRLSWPVAQNKSKQKAEEQDEEEEEDLKPAAKSADPGWKSTSSSSKKSSPKKADTKEKNQIWNCQEKMEWVLKKDRENENAFPLFAQVFPRTGAKCSFTVREKSFQLGNQVLAHPIPFVIWALAEPTIKDENRVLRKWFPMADVKYIRDRSLAWSPTESATRQEGLDIEGVGHGLGFLDELDLDPLDALNCEVQIDLEMTSVRDIDDGAKVIGAMQDILDLREQELHLREENHRQAEEIERLRRQLQANGGDCSANG